MNKLKVQNPSLSLWQRTIPRPKVDNFRINLKERRFQYYIDRIMATAQSTSRSSGNTPLSMQQFIELGKLPDFIRDLNSFDGKPSDLLAWLTDVEGIYNMFREAGATEAQLSLIERSVRRKIKGEAADVLNANNITHDWPSIKNTLILYYRDKRDIKTLDYELTSIRKAGNETLASYYSRVNELLAAIIAQLQTEDKYYLHVTSHTEFFRDKAVDAFIRGLEKPLCFLLKTHNPKTLSQAYQFCLDFYNMDTRSAPFRNEHSSPIPRPRELEPSKFPPRPPPRRQHPTPAPRTSNFHQMPPFARQYSSNYHQTSPFERQNFQFTMQPPARPWYPKPQPRPEPMEVDRSIRSRNINYGNRPPMDARKPFPLGSQVHPHKRQACPIDTNIKNLNQFDYDSNSYEDNFYDPYYYPQQVSSEEHESFSQSDGQTPSTSSSTHFLEWNPSW